jgi:hypothetical protein
MVEYIMKKEIYGTFHAKCRTRDLTQVFGAVPRKAGRVVSLDRPVYVSVSHLSAKVVLPPTDGLINYSFVNIIILERIFIKLGIEIMPLELIPQ